MNYSRYVEQRVEGGAKFLDETVPGWYDRVDPLTLDVRSTWRCVVAQVTGQLYGVGLDALGVDRDQARSLGFAALREECALTGTMIVVYELLTQSWRRAIAERRAVDRLLRSTARSWFGHTLRPRRTLQLTEVR